MIVNENCPHFKNKEKCIAIEGRGDKNSPIMIIGMDPSYEEVKQNLPFVGPSGKLLNKVLEELSIDKQVYITNAIKCFFTIGTKPDKYIEAWRQSLIDEIQEIKPKAILCLGAVAVKSLLPDKSKESIRNLRERLHFLYSYPLVVSYHPSAILRTGSESSDLYNKLKSDIDWIRSICFGEQIEIKEKPTEYRIISTREDVIQALEYHSKFDKTAVDFETNTRKGKSLWAHDANALTLSLSSEEGKSHCIPLAHPESPFINELPWLTNVITKYLRDMNLVAQNAPFESACFDRWFGKGITIKDDTILQAYVKNEHGSHSLHSLIKEYYPAKKDHKEYYLSHPNIENDQMPLNELAIANLEDSDYTLRLYNRFNQELDEDDQRFYKDYMMGQFFPVVDTMIKNGLQVDLDYVRNIIPYYINMQNECEKTAQDTFGININSSEQLSKALLELGFVLPHSEKKGHSANKEAMKHTKHYASPDKLPILYFIEKSKEYAYINKYYLSKMFRWIGQDGKCHPSYKLFGTISGRLSSSEPNAQNLGKRGDVKKMFTAGDGWFISLDFSSHEYRIFSMLAEDNGLMDKFRQGLDPHLVNASMIFNKPQDQINKEERFIAKTLGFGCLYGSGAQTQSKQLGVSQQKAEQLVKWYKQTYPSVNKWYSWSTNSFKNNGYFTLPIGRKWRNNNLGFSAQVNLPIQGLAGYVCLMGAYRLLNKGYQLVQSVHDSIVIQMDTFPRPEDLYDIYQTAINVEVPGYEHIKGLFDAELAVGKNLGELVTI